MIDNAADWSTFWTQHKSIFFPPPALPPIDFTQVVVLAAFDGTKPTAGYSFDIDAVIYTGTALNVEATAQQPGTGCFTLQVITFPFQIVTVDRAVNAPAGSVQKDVLTYTCP